MGRPTKVDRPVKRVIKLTLDPRADGARVRELALDRGLLLGGALASEDSDAHGYTPAARWRAGSPITATPQSCAVAGLRVSSAQMS